MGSLCDFACGFCLFVCFPLPFFASINHVKWQLAFASGFCNFFAFFFSLFLGAFSFLLLLLLLFEMRGCSNWIILWRLQFISPKCSGFLHVFSTIHEEFWSLLFFWMFGGLIFFACKSMHVDSTSMHFSSPGNKSPRNSLAMWQF